MAAFGLVEQAVAGKRHPKRGGTLQYSSCSDIAGLDSHRHNQNYIYAVTAAMYTGLSDLDYEGNIVPGIHYPTNLQAPDAFETSSEHPISTGPFRFVSWTRWSETKLVRFENYWETGAEDNQLPYLDEIISKPKKEGSVRLTALRTGQVELIDAMAQADVEAQA